MMTILHDNVIYPGERLIPLKSAAVLGYCPLEFEIRFFCKSLCHPSAPFKLAFGVFTRNHPSQPSDTIYGCHQERCDVKYPIEIK